jgi:hypothetical protein
LAGFGKLSGQIAFIVRSGRFYGLIFNVLNSIQ